MRERPVRANRRRGRPTGGDSSFLWVHLLFLFVIIVISLLAGRYPEAGFLDPFSLGDDPLTAALVLRLRLPRILFALLLGASLASAGTVLQMIFANPLVEPGFLGVSQGAAFGAAIGILLGSSAAVVQGSAILWAWAGLFLSFLVARRLRYGGWLLRLLLSGIAVSALFTSGLGIVKLLADPMSQLPEITYWLLGGLWSISWNSLMSVLPVIIPALILLHLFRWRINLLSLPELSSHSVGARPMRERTLILMTATAAVASAVAVSGIIGWVGLIIPHISRRLFGSDMRRALPGAMITGATFTLICDTIARSIVPGEVPLGILTSLTGSVLFVLLLMFTGRGVRQ